MKDECAQVRIMSAEEAQKKLNFIQNVLPKLILERNADLKDQIVVKCQAEACSQLDGFMSAIYTVVLVLKDVGERWVLNEELCTVCDCKIIMKFS